MEGSNSVPGLAALAVVIQFVNDRAPVVTFDTLTDSGQAQLSDDSPPGTFVAHISASDPNRGPNGHVTCRLGAHGDRFRLVRMFHGEYKMLTLRSFDALGTIVVDLSCSDHGDPPLSTSTTINVTITAPDGADSPVFSQTVYNASLPVITSHTPVFVIRVLANSQSDGGNISYSFGQRYTAFSIARTTGVIEMVNTASSEADTVELDVVATAVSGRSSRVSVYVSLVQPEHVVFVKRSTPCRVKEGAKPGTAVCSLADTDVTMATDRCVY